LSIGPAIQVPGEMNSHKSLALGVKRPDRRFFPWLAMFFALLVFAGFSPSFYLHALFHRPLPPSTLIEFHGALMTGWILLFLVQTFLVETGRLSWHRQFGIAGFAYAALIVPIGCVATLYAAGREIRAHSAFVPSQLNVLGLELTQMLLFAGLVLAGVLLRNRGDFHKRMMAMASLCILPNAVVRLILLSNINVLGSNLVILTMWALLVLCIIGIDAYRLGRLHPAFAWSASLAIASLYLAWLGSTTAAWNRYWIQVLR
jgi:hypothetical protein